MEATFRDNYIVVEAALNGTGPYRLLLDTGASHLALSPAVQKRANLARHLFTKVPVKVVGGTRTMRANLVRVDVLQAGGLRLEGVRALVPEGKRWEGVSRSVAQATMVEGIDGFLGMNALAGVILEIDYPGRKVVLHRHDRADFPAERAAVCEFVNHIPYVVIQLGQQDIRVMIDTGFNGTFNLSTLDDLPLLYPPQRFDGPAGFGVGGTEPRTAESQIDGDIRLGPVSWRHAEVGTTRGHPSVGTAALRWWRLAFDQSAGKVFFLGNNDTMITEKRGPINPRYKSGYFGEIQGRFIRLVEVDSGGAFDRAGLRVGDLITAVDGVLPFEWLRGRARGEIPLLNAMQVSVLRNGAKFETTVLQGPENGSNQ